jgi:hypothetical protein
MLSRSHGGGESGGDVVLAILLHNGIARNDINLLCFIIASLVQYWIQWALLSAKKTVDCEATMQHCCVLN